MVTSIEETFKSSFHSLKGLTVAEKRKNLFFLLNDTKQHIQHEPDKFDVSCLQPKTPLEEIFLIDVLLYFEKASELLEVLKCGNPALIEKILKCQPALFTKIFNITGKELMLVFPCFSYNTKLKVLNKLALYLNDVDRGDDFFKVIKETYGTYLASKLLPVCSGKLILNCLELNKIEIVPKQLVSIIRRYPSLTVEVIEKLYKGNEEIKMNNKYVYVFKYIMKHDSENFWKLCQKYDLDFRVGSRTTRKFIKNYKNDVVKNSKIFYKLLKKKQAYKYCKNQDFVDFFYNVLPKSLKRLEENLEEYLGFIDLLPSNEQKFELLRTTFKKIHGRDIENYTNFMTQKLIELMSPNDRELWMQTHSKPKEVTEETWIAFMKIQHSIPMLKKNISLTSNIKDRAKIIGALIATCRINKDEAALADVCVYVVKCHRNDNIIVQEKFLSSIHDDYNLKKLKLEHWEPIMELIHLISFNGEKIRYNYIYSDFVEAFIYFCMDKQLPIKKEFQLLIDIRCYQLFNICKENPTYEKKCLELFYEVIPLCCKDDDLQDIYVEFLSCINMWNKRNPNNMIDIFKYEEAIEALIFKLDNNNVYPTERVAFDCIIANYSNSNNLLERFLNIKWSYNYYSTSLIRFLLKNDYQTLLKCLDRLIENLFLSHISLKNLRALFRNYTYSIIFEKISIICFNIINDNQQPDKKRIAVFLLSLVLPSADFLKFASSYYPSNAIIVYENIEMNFFKIQKSIPPSLRALNPPFIALDAILNFCKGDYLKLVQKSLSSVSLNVAENQLHPFLDSLIDQPVSVRKHAIILGFKLLNKTKKYELLTKFMETDNNLTIRKSLFKVCFNLFLKDPDDYTWELVKLNAKAINLKDTEAFHKLTDSEKVSNKYFAQYVLFTWDVLNELHITDKIDHQKSRVLSSITRENIVDLPNEFCLKIIDKHLFKLKRLDKLQEEFQSFACKYLLHYNSEDQENRIKKILEAVERCAKENMESIIYSFIQRLSTAIVELKCLNNVAFSFIESWNRLFKPHEAFDEYLLLQFTLIFMETINNENALEQIAEKLVALCLYLETLECMDVGIFCKRLELFKHNFLMIDEDSDVNTNELILLEYFIKICNKPNCLIIALSLLHTLNDDTTCDNVKLKWIIKYIKGCSTPIVQMHLHHYFVDIKLSE